MTGAGPELPAPGPIHRTTVVGRLEVSDPEDDPAGRRLRLEVPIEHGPRFETVTDAQGRFVFPAIPIGPYTLERLGERRDMWWQTPDPHSMRSGEVPSGAAWAP